MRHTPARRRAARALIVVAGIAALAACGKPAEPTYEADVTDKSGGELIVEDADATGVPVTLPETPMTPVPPGAEASAPASQAAPAR